MKDFYPSTTKKISNNTLYTAKEYIQIDEQGKDHDTL